MRRVCEQWAFQRILIQETSRNCTYFIRKQLPRPPIKKFFVLHYIITNIFSGIVVASSPFLLTHFPHSYVEVKMIMYHHDI